MEPEQITLAELVRRAAAIEAWLADQGVTMN
jgi:hypothetical protein